MCLLNIYICAIINILENNNAKDYKDSSMEEEGLIGWISNLFNKK